MAFVVLLLVAGGLGAYGYWRGGLRFGLTLSPLLLASFLVWLFGPLIYRIDGLRSAGLIWPGLILVVIGLTGGYALQFFYRKKLPKKLRRADRITGSVVGVIISIIVVWLGCVYFVVWSASTERGHVGGSASWVAQKLNAGVVRWIPAIGTGSDAMMNLVEIANTEEGTRRQAIEDLGLNRLLDLPQMQVLLADEETQSDVQAAATGNIAAVWRLQKNPHVLRLLETEEIANMVNRRSLDDIAKAMRKATGQRPPEERKPDR